MKNLYYLFLALLILSCSSGPETENALNNAQPENKKIDSLVIVQTDSVVPENQFSVERINRFSELLAEYWNKEGYGENGLKYNVRIDTSKEGKLKHYRYRLKSKYSYGYDFSIFEFGTPEEASDYFNDLKTQEMVVGFGLNKRPNHILVDGNKVYWHYLDHPTGHRMKDFKRIFNEAFNFHPGSSNLDSVSGFTYCQCFDQDADFSGLKGMWKSKNFVYVFAEGIKYYYFNQMAAPDTVILKFNKDSVDYNGSLYTVRRKTSIQLPDSYFYIKYAYFDRSDDSLHTSEFRSLLGKIADKKCSLTVYSLNISNGLSFEIIKLKTGECYCMINNKFYKIVSKK